MSLYEGSNGIQAGCGRITNDDAPACRQRAGAPRFSRTIGRLAAYLTLPSREALQHRYQ